MKKFLKYLILFFLLFTTFTVYVAKETSKKYDLENKSKEEIQQIFMDDVKRIKKKLDEEKL